MKAKKLMLVIAVAVLAFTSNMFAAQNVALSPAEATVTTIGPNSSLTLEAFCSTAACNLRWYVVGSNPRVGALESASGLVNHFQAGGSAGTAIVIVQDEAGNMSFAKITVVQSGLR